MSWWLLPVLASSSVGCCCAGCNWREAVSPHCVYEHCCADMFLCLVRSLLSLICSSSPPPPPPVPQQLPSLRNPPEGGQPNVTTWSSKVTRGPLPHGLTNRPSSWSRFLIPSHMLGYWGQEWQSSLFLAFPKSLIHLWTCTISPPTNLTCNDSSPTAIQSTSTCNTCYLWCSYLPWPAYKLIINKVHNNTLVEIIS